MPEHFLLYEETVRRINQLCLCLFLLWCEERKLVPLAYLLRCWPLTDDTPAAIKRLADAMSELARGQPALLGAHGSSMLRALIASARDIVGEPLPRSATATGSNRPIWGAYE